jgi:hypothetical protein
VAADGIQLARPAGCGKSLKTPVRILRGRYAGREGWISGTLEDRARRGITKAIVKFADAPAELLATSGLEESLQLALPYTDEAQKARRQAQGPAEVGWIS